VETEGCWYLLLLVLVAANTGVLVMLWCCLVNLKTSFFLFFFGTGLWTLDLLGRPMLLEPCLQPFLLWLFLR
jgi:hypothetical protein